MKEVTIDENDEVIDYELIADDDSMVLKNRKILKVKTKDNITSVLVEATMRGIRKRYRILC
ncbi:hypothetical protein A500_12644 [Clostridium sartagoforme AAU1]|uniref:Uncharacterized protein n=1 Tax=Clostridium sartagoforme AAU1 TaxID=1202534 RepID=R9C573_9CLOT|nr:hypothetical protein [Clostridium sartagoforme]EOR24452.1 hypothetical protein A500_12644 [Clostridium sartagoforme AAU1]